ncbi:hypothetical protein BG003_000850, partial [Podila horticola]
MLHKKLLESEVKSKLKGKIYNMGFVGVAYSERTKIVQWKVGDLDLLAKFDAFRSKPQSPFSLALDGIADVCSEFASGLSQDEQENLGRDLSVETEVQACMADAVAILEGQQIYLAEAALIHDPKLDKEPQDKFKVVHLRFLCKSVISLVIKVKTHYSVRHVFQIAFPKLQ